MRNACLNRCFAEPARWAESGTLELDPEESRHLARVLHARPGDAVEVFDGLGRHAEGRVLSLGRAVRLQLETPIIDAEEIHQIRLQIGMPREAKLDWLLQKSTELGVTALTLFAADRSVVRLDAHSVATRMDRWTRIVKDAAKQSGRTRLPLLSWAPGLPPLLRDPPDGLECRMVCSLEAAPGSMPRIFEEGLARNCRIWTFFIGPEGDFSPAELEVLRRERVGEISLGPRVLRVETAGIYALSALLYALEKSG